MIRKTNGYLEEYYQKCKSGEIIIGHELMMELEKLMSDLNNDKYIYDTTAADLRIDFMQGCIRLTKSPFYGKPMILMLWQKAFITAVYSFKMADTGFDRFKKVILLIGRKNTKSETCSALGLTELIIGNDGADIVCSSNDDNQASILYDAIDTMRLMIDPEEKDIKRNQRFIRCLLNGSKIFKLSDRTRNKEGRNIDFAVIDETHEMKDNVIAKSIEQSQSLKDNPKFINITTEGFVNDGYLDGELKRARQILNGEIQDKMSDRTLIWLYTQDSEQEVWQDRNSWYKSNPTLGVVKKWEYLDEQVDLARTSKADRMFVLSKDFNFKMNNAEAWLLPEDYIYEAKFNIEDFRNCVCLGAVDLSETTDLTCAKILLMKPNDNTKYVLAKYWIPEGKLEKSDDKESGAKYVDWIREGLIEVTEGNENDLTKVADWFYKLYKEYGIQILKCGYDQKFAKDFLKRMEEYGFECEMVPQGMAMSQAMKLVEADLKSQILNYNENPVDSWCFGNASMQIDNFGQVMAVKINNQATRRIDGAVTTIILYEMFRRYKSEFMQNVR